MRDYESRVNRPPDPYRLAAEVHRLHREGLRVRDIAQAFHMNDADVALLLCETGMRAQRSS